MFYHFIPDTGVRLIGSEAAGRGIDTLEHAATIAKGKVGIFHGMKSIFCQNDDGQIDQVYSITPASDRNTRTCTTLAGLNTCRSRMMKL